MSCTSLLKLGTPNTLETTPVARALGPTPEIDSQFDSQAAGFPCYSGDVGGISILQLGTEWTLADTNG